MEILLEFLFHISKFFSYLRPIFNGLITYLNEACSSVLNYNKKMMESELFFNERQPRFYVKQIVGSIYKLKDSLLEVFSKIFDTKAEVNNHTKNQILFEIITSSIINAQMISLL